MTDKELKQSSRKELLELLLEQTNENKVLRAELDMLREQLEDKEIRIHESGTLAEAALRLNRLFEAADAAVMQYLENIKYRVEDSQKESNLIDGEAEEMTLSPQAAVYKKRLKTKIAIKPDSPEPETVPKKAIVEVKKRKKWERNG